MAYTFDYLEPGLALAEKPTSAADVATLPFMAILNVCDQLPPAYAAGLPTSVEVMLRPFEDNIPAPRAFLLVAVLELAAARGRGLATLVHCQAGQSRSPTVIALYWMARDHIAWTDALRRLRTARPRVDPHPLLTDAATRDAVVAMVRQFLDGDATVLTAARAEAEALWSAHRGRGADGPHDQGAWTLIEEGLGCGGDPWAGSEVRQAGFTCVLNLEPSGVATTTLQKLPGFSQVMGCRMREADPVDPQALAAAVRQLRLWRTEQRAVLVRCSDGKSRAALVIALYLMVDRGWDFAAAMWYIRQRRLGAWPRLQLFEGRSLAELLESCRKGHDAGTAGQ